MELITFALVCKLTLSANKVPLTVESIPLTNCTVLNVPTEPINLDGDITKHPGWVKNDSKDYVIPVGELPPAKSN